MKIIIITLIFLSNLALTQDVRINENNNKKLMGVLGSFASSNIYLSYLNVDMLAEQVLEKKIEKEKGAKILLSLNQIINQLEQNLRELHKIAESNKDASLMYRLIYIAERMKEDASNLQNYIKDQTAEKLERFKKSHNSIFANLQSLFMPKNK